MFFVGLYVSLTSLNFRILLILQVFETFSSSRRRNKLETYNKTTKMDDDSLEWTHRCLEEVYVGGFTGCEYELELLNYFLKTCTSLKKIALDPYTYDVRQTGVVSLSVYPHSERVQCARDLARQFGRDKVHSDIKFLVL